MHVSRWTSLAFNQSLFQTFRYIRLPYSQEHPQGVKHWITAVHSTSVAHANRHLHLVTCTPGNLRRGPHMALRLLDLDSQSFDWLVDAPLSAGI